MRVDMHSRRRARRPATPGPGDVRWCGRDPDEQHRASTPLELLFDLTFVVAVAQVSAELAHAIVDGTDVGGAVVSYLMTFFAIWWAWVNFTWFASAYDSDDVPYRLLTLVQMLGVLILASAVPQLFEHHDFTWARHRVRRDADRAGGQWLRAAGGRPGAPDDGPALRGRRHGGAGRLARLPRGAAETWRLPAFVVLAALDVLVPVWAERTADDAVARGAHRRAVRPVRHHRARRVRARGDGGRAADPAGQRGADGCAGRDRASAAWCWSSRSGGCTSCGRSRRRSTATPDAIFAWGYVHYGVFAALAALGSGLEVAAETLGHHEPAGRTRPRTRRPRGRWRSRSRRSC